MSERSNAPVTLGFLTVVQEPSGWVGGYLVTNSWGRPLEFRLTTAVQPNRVQTAGHGRSLVRDGEVSLLLIRGGAPYAADAASTAEAVLPDKGARFVRVERVGHAGLLRDNDQIATDRERCQNRRR